MRVRQSSGHCRGDAAPPLPPSRSRRFGFTGGVFSFSLSAVSASFLANWRPPEKQDKTEVNLVF